MKTKAELPTSKEYSHVITCAYLEAKRAAQRELEHCQKTMGEREIYGSFGGAFLILRVDGRSSFGKFLKEHKDFSPLASLRRSSFRKGVFVNFILFTPRQEQRIVVAGEKAALEVLERRFGVKGYIHKYAD